MLELKHIHKYYNPGTVHEMCLFEDFNLTIEKGNLYPIVSSNGSGKTSLLNIICGSIELDEENSGRRSGYYKAKEYSVWRKSDVCIKIRYGTCPSMTILENMAMADNKGKAFGLKRGTDKKRIAFYKEELAKLQLGLEDKLNTKVGALSGGQRQALAL